MEYKLLADHLLIYVDKEIAKNFTIEKMIMNEFYFMKHCR
jgi:hypothetical protein